MSLPLTSRDKEHFKDDEARDLSYPLGENGVCFSVEFEA